MPRTNALAIHAAKQEWSRARPSSAMTILAEAGLDSGARRYVLRSWGVSVDDAIDFASDRYVMTEETCPWTSADECSMAAERSVAGTADPIPSCPIH